MYRKPKQDINSTTMHSMTQLNVIDNFYDRKINTIQEPFDNYLFTVLMIENHYLTRLR